jgi:amino acid permease
LAYCFSPAIYNWRRQLIANMGSDDVSTETVSDKIINEKPPKYSEAAQDIKPSDAENNNNQSPPGELKRKLKSRHLQMIAIGSFSTPYQIDRI